MLPMLVGAAKTRDDAFSAFERPTTGECGAVWV